MTQALSLRTWTMAGIIAMSAFGVTAVVNLPLSAHGGDQTLIHACVKQQNGQVRIVERNDNCLPSEVPKHWAIGGAMGQVGSIMVHGGGFGAGGSPLAFVHFGGGIPVYSSPRDGVIQNLRVLTTTNTFNGPTTVTLFINGFPTSVSTVIPAGSVGGINITGTFMIFDGDAVSVILNRGASNSGSLELSVTYEIL